MAQQKPIQKRNKKHKLLKARIEPEEADPDQYTVYKLKPGWEKVMSDVWSPDTIKKFKHRQELFSKIPSEVRDRTKTDKSYSEGWVDAASWILDNIMRPKDDNIQEKIE